MRIKIPYLSFISIVLVASSVAFIVNSYSIQQLPIKSSALRENQTIRTADDKSYLSPVETYLTTGVWKEKENGTASYYKRSPGYGLFLLPFLNCFSHDSALLFIKMTQCIFHGILAGLMYLLFLYFKIKRKFSFFAALFFGISPVFYSYVFYTLTEGITASLLFFLCWIYFVKPFKNEWLNAFLLAFVFAFLFLVRPVLGIFALIPFFYCFRLQHPFKIYLSFLIVVICFLPYGYWMQRNYSIKPESFSLHPIYDNENATVWRLPHQSLYEFIKQYNPSAQEYHTWNKKLWSAAKQGTSFEEIDSPLSIYNKHSLKLFGQDTLQHYTALYFESLKEVPAYAKAAKYSKKEELVSASFLTFSERYSKENWMESKVIIPLKVLKQIVFTSDLSLFIFRDIKNQSPTILFLKYMYGGMHVLLFFIPLVIPFIDWHFFKKNTVVFLSIGLYLFYLCYFQRGIENRYSFPILPVLYVICILGSYHWLQKKLFKGRNSSNIISGN